MGEELSRQERIQACLREVTRRPDFPAFSHHIQELMHALGDEEASLRRLTALVLRDFSLTLKVLRTANSVQYNRSGRHILSVTHAVALLGVDAIRYLAGSLALFEHFRKQSPGLRELMLLSLLTANQARSVAARIGYPRREEAYLCGMFRNLGEVLVASYFPSQYAAILGHIKEANLSDREACLRVLHFTYEELGHAMALHWNMPDKVARCMRGGEEKLGRAGTHDVDLLPALTSFSHSLTTVEELNLTMVPATARNEALIPADDTEQQFLRHVSPEPIHIDEVRRRSGLPIATVSSALAMLELKGWCGRWAR